MIMRIFFSALVFFGNGFNGSLGSEMVDPNAKIRHSANTRPLELNVDAKDTYNDKFMALMESACRPEMDGYFGATYGEPVKITYGFQLEAQPLSTIMDLLEVVEDKVVDNVLSNMFPQICGFRRRRLASHASGFRFYKFHEEERCDPSQDPMNFCGYFTGQVNVYGREQDNASTEALKMITETLNPSDPTKLHPKLVSVTNANQYQQVTGGNVQLKQDMRQEILVWTGLAAVIVLFTFTVWWFFIRKDKQGDTGVSAKSLNRRGWLFARQRNGTFDPEEKSIKPSFEPEAAAFSGGDQLLPMDGRPVYSDNGGSSLYSDYDDSADFDDIDFDNVDSSVSATTAELI